jgi:hypothetical protein
MENWVFRWHRHQCMRRTVIDESIEAVEVRIDTAGDVVCCPIHENNCSLHIVIYNAA